MLTPDQWKVLEVLVSPHSHELEAWDIGERGAPFSILDKGAWGRCRLTKLCVAGLVVGTRGHRRSVPGMTTYYTITPAGRKALEEQA